MKMGKHALRGLPRYDRKIPWRTFVSEFKSWVEMNDVYLCGDEFIKNAMVGCMKGQAMDMVNAHRRGSPTYTNNQTWRQYAIAIEAIFSPPAESQLAKQEFKNYKQKAMEDVSSYLSTKRALYEIAYHRHGEGGNFDNFLDEIIQGLCNREVKLQLRRANPRNMDALEQMLVQIVANERAAYEQGYSRSETKDGLYHTTILGRRHATEQPEGEPMDITALKNQVTAMEAQLQENISAILDKSKITCYKCQKKGHMAKDCRTPIRGGGQYSGGNTRGRGGPSGGRFGSNRGRYNPGGPSGGRFQFECFYCKKKGHKKSQCHQYTKDKQAGKVREMDEEQPDDEGSSGYSRFLGDQGEIEEN